MKAKLTFNLPEENTEHIQATNGGNLASVVYDFDQWLRSQQKYETREEIPVDELREKLRDMMADVSITFESPIFM